MKAIPALRTLTLAVTLALPALSSADEITDAIAVDYNAYLEDLFLHFHENPELSFQEHATAARMAEELRAAGFTVTKNVGQTGVVAILENGPGPLVAMRADMDGLPVKENSGLPYASMAQQLNPATGQQDFVMHACGHDVHITSLVGTARQLAARRDQWSGTAMLIVQPAEEIGSGAKAMRADNIWERFGTPDYVLGFHVSAGNPTWTLNLLENASPYAGADMVDIIVHGVGGHGAYPHATKDPVVLGAQIVLALQTLVSRELAPHEPGVVTVGAFHAGTKHNIISEEAVLQLTVRNTNPQTREKLLSGIQRIAENMGRVAGLPEDMLPEMIIREETVPPLMNDSALATRINGVWRERIGADVLITKLPDGMGAEDYPFFTTDPSIPSIYWEVGGTPQEAFDAAANGGPAVAGHHSPQFKIAPEPAVRMGVDSTVRAMMALMPD
ncbi:MAG: amidohydrolase [Pseudohongiellaceae bacterium]